MSDPTPTEQVPRLGSARRRGTARCGIALSLLCALGVWAATGAAADDDDVGTLRCGVPEVAALEARTTDTYRLAGGSGVAVVDVVDTSGSIGLMRLGTPSAPDTCTGALTVQLPEPGLLRVADCFGNQTGTYTVTASVVSDTEANCGRPMPCGLTPHVRTFAIPGEVDAYTFEGSVGDRVVLRATDDVRSLAGGIKLRVFDPTGAPVGSGESCRPSTTLNLLKKGTYTVLASLCDAPASGVYGLAIEAPSCPQGPDVSYFGLARADGSPVDPREVDGDGRLVFNVPNRAGFIVVVEGRPGPSDQPVGRRAFNYDPANPAVLPDVQVLFSRRLGNGSPAVCDKSLPDAGGVPAVPSLQFDGTQRTANAINDYGCRVNDGTGLPQGVGPDDACTFFPDGEYRFVNPHSTIQFCEQISLPWSFPRGTTVLRARVRDIEGRSGPPREIIVHTGEEESPALVRDIAPGPASSDPHGFVHSLGGVLFAADTPDTGAEPWRSDGQSTGTTLVRDTRPGPAGSSPAEMTLVPGAERVFMVANDGTHGAELWASAGTPNTTQLVRDIRPGSASSQPTWLTAAGNLLFFAADDGNTGTELWRSDGESTGTRLVRDINTGPAGSAPAGLLATGTTVFFAADDGEHGAELWKSNGTDAGTVLVRDIAPGEDGSLPGELTAVAGIVYFVADDEQHGSELWRSDGTPEGTRLVADIVAGERGSAPAHLTSVSGLLYFSADDGVHGFELWRSDGTATGTVLVKDIVPGPAGSAPESLTAVAGRLFFSAYDDAHGRELWTSTGGAAGTVLVKDIIPGPPGSEPTNLQSASGVLAFSARDSTNGREPWTSDGTVAGTRRAADIAPGPASSDPMGFTILGTSILSGADDAASGRELWSVPVPLTDPTCTGDCNRDGEVTVDELIVAVRISLGESSVELCSEADSDADGTVTIDEILQGVNASLGGCPAG